MYQWDSVKNNKNIPFLAKCFHKVFSFDREDCKNFGYYYLPNFYISSIKNNSSNENNYDLLFVGKGHTDRVYLLNKIKESLPKEIKTKFIIYLPWYRFFIEKYLIKQRGSLSISNFTFKKISYNKVQTLVAASKVILDIHNPFQKGLTQRPFDALGNGKGLITTNANIKKEYFYDENVIHVLNRKNPIINIDIFTNKTKMTLGFEKYSLENWLKNIFI